jgi:hypothetical protein
LRGLDACLGHVKRQHCCPHLRSSRDVDNTEDE